MDRNRIAGSFCIGPLSLYRVAAAQEQQTADPTAATSASTVECASRVGEKQICVVRLGRQRDLRFGSLRAGRPSSTVHRWER